MENASPRLTLHALDPEAARDREKVQEFWSGILRDYLPDSAIEEPRLVPLANLLEHVTGLGGVSVIAQSDVQDPDYAAEYQAYYGRIFANVERCCKRLHCFSRHWNENTDVLAAIDAAMDADYLGFITLRPIKVSPVGATILRPPTGSAHFILSKDQFEVHLAGKTFKVEGTPFMQQDNAVGACAQASIWMAMRTLRRREGLAAHDPAQITSSATRFYIQGRTLPNREGLVIHQMMEAVRSAGYSPTLLRFREPADGKPRTTLVPTIKTMLYPYVESEIPVILVLYTQELGGHAVVLIGHGWRREPMLCSPTLIRRGDKSFYVRNCVDWASPFYMHNDNTGPYLPIEDTGPKEAYTLDKVCYAIPLLPCDVYMTAEEAEQAAVRLIGHFGQGKYLDNGTHAIRTYLQERYRFREEARTSTMAEALRRHYRLKAVPRRMWITEINLQSGYGGSQEGRGTRIGEVLIDPTGEPTQAPFLSIHLPGILIDRDPTSGRIDVHPIPDDGPYSPLVRKPAS